MEEGEEGKEKSKNRKTGWSQVYKQLWTYGQPEEEKQERDFPDSPIVKTELRMQGMLLAKTLASPAHQSRMKNTDTQCWGNRYMTFILSLRGTQ